MEGAAPSRRGGMKSRRSRSFSSLLGGYPGISEEVPQGSNLAPTNQPPVSQSDPSLLKIMVQMATIMGQISQAAAPRDNSKAPAFKTPSMKEPDSFDGTWAHKLRGFIQSCQLIFHNDPENFFSDRKKILYSTSFLTGRVENRLNPTSPIFPMKILPTSSIIGSYLKLNSSLFLVIPMRRGLASRLLDQLASYPGNLDTLQELMDITLESDTRYHERQKEKGSNQEKKPPVTGSNPSRPPQDLYFKGLTVRRI
ncbi:hypothetical protein O181_104813 [Austropuccinia psidii MF-1]|uniref:Uncharacterized protein n=1 Tax=Austropuccinia psidii MF-1 TaxID=1389203 RepID=A0A9Q3PKD8_9BASI|nr:hypothetical protein [Austropuccinia psidii MF-1]